MRADSVHHSRIITQMDEKRELVSALDIKVVITEYHNCRGAWRKALSDF